jgi:hypothetical protein
LKEAATDAVGLPVADVDGAIEPLSDALAETLPLALSLALEVAEPLWLALGDAVRLLVTLADDEMDADVVALAERV